MNLYAYAGNNPVTFSDPFGLCPPELTGRPCGNILGGRDMILRADVYSGFGRTSERSAGIHQGADYLADVGTTVTSADKGVVSRIGYDKQGYGHFIQLAHKNDKGQIVSYTFYGHLKEAPKMTIGDPVEAGAAIGVSGQSGNAPGTPPHVHFEIRTRRFPGKGLGNRCDPAKAVAGEADAC